MDYNLERGDGISTMLQREVQESKILVAVCSENAANSNWCLVETARMLECKEIMASVFCDVDPSRHCLVNCDTGSVKKMMCGNILGEYMHHGSLENHLFGNGWRSDYGEAGSFKHSAEKWDGCDEEDKVHKNDHPRMLYDDVWRLENIGKGGALHRKLSSTGIKTVQDFLKFAVTDSPKLRKTLVIGMSDKMLLATLKNTMTCGTASKTHKCCAPQFTIICRLARADINGQTFTNRDLMSHGGANVWPLSWHSRLKVAIGIARGLNFLHSREKEVIYRDFKSSNILLDKNYNAKLSDFGLAKFGPSEGQSHVTTRVMGTYGYAAPGNLYEKSDVYGFGLVLLEILIGSRAINAKQNMVEWVKPHLSNKRKLKTIIDAKSECQYSFTYSQLRKATASFVLNDAKRKPQMQQQVQNERMKTVQRVSSSVTTAIVFLMLIYHIFIQFEKEKQHEQVFPLLEPFGFVMFIGAVTTMIVVGAPFSVFLTAMLFFWAILMLLMSTKSLTELYLPIGVIFMGWNMVMEKQSPYQV